MRTKEAIGVLIILSIITSAFFYKIIFTDRVLVAADILGQYLPWKLYPGYGQRPHNPNLSDSVDSGYPMRYYASGTVKKGILPLWDPTMLCGTPFLANNESALFNPFYILFYILAPARAFGYVSMLLVLFAGLFMYIFMRGIEIGRFGSLVAAITYMFNSFFIIWMWHLSIISVGLWLPLILFFIEKFLRTRKFIYSLWAGLFFGIQFLCGFIQLSFYIILGVLIYAFMRIMQLKPKRYLPYSLGLISMFIIGFGLGAVQWLPTWELIRLCQRTQFPWGFNLFDLSSVLHLASFVFPNIFGSPMDYNYWGAPNYSELCGYLGILPLILALIALFYRRDKFTSIAFCIAIFALLVYLDTPLNGLLSFTVPGYAKGIAPNRIIFLYFFSGAVLAGLGGDYLENNRPINSKLRMLIRFILTGILILIVSILFFILALRIWGRSIVDLIVSVPLCNSAGILPILEKAFAKIHSLQDIIKYFRLFSPAIYLPLALILISLWLLNFYLKKGASLIFKTIAIVIIIIDIFYFGMRYLATADRRTVFPQLESVGFLKKDKDLFRVISLGNVFPKNTIVPYDIQTAQGYLSLFPKRYEEICLFMDKTSRIGTGGGIEFSRAVTESALPNLLNVKYILSEERIENAGFKLLYDGEILIYENKGVLPRAFIVPKFKVIKNREDIFRELNNGTFNPREYVILEEWPKLAYEPLAVRGSTVSIAEYSANIIELKADILTPAFLFLSDTDYPGWEVYVDGKKDKIYRANYVFRAVHLECGKHLIKFIFRPFSFRMGLSLSILTLSISLIGVILSLKKRRV